jgi:hypothetical protein
MCHHLVVHAGGAVLQGLDTCASVAKGVARAVVGDGPLRRYVLQTSPSAGSTDDEFLALGSFESSGATPVLASSSSAGTPTVPSTAASDVEEVPLPPAPTLTFAVTALRNALSLLPSPSSSMPADASERPALPAGVSLGVLHRGAPADGSAATAAGGSGSPDAGPTPAGTDAARFDASDGVLGDRLSKTKAPPHKSKVGFAVLVCAATCRLRLICFGCLFHSSSFVKPFWLSLHMHTSAWKTHCRRCPPRCSFCICLA